MRILDGSERSGEGFPDDGNAKDAEDLVQETLSDVKSGSGAVALESLGDPYLDDRLAGDA